MASKNFQYIKTVVTSYIRSTVSKQSESIDAFIEEIKTSKYTGVTARIIDMPPIKVRLANEKQQDDHEFTTIYDAYKANKRPKTFVQHYFARDPEHAVYHTIENLLDIEKQCKVQTQLINPKNEYVSAAKYNLMRIIVESEAHKKPPVLLELPPKEKIPPKNK